MKTTNPQRNNTNYTNNNYNKQDQTWEFIDTLVRAILGRSIQEIPEEHREEMVGQCIEVFSDYIIKYVEVKFGKKDAVRLQAAQKFLSEDLFTKFQDLADKFDEAYGSFFQNLEKNWDQQISLIQQQQNLPKQKSN